MKKFHQRLRECLLWVSYRDDGIEYPICVNGIDEMKKLVEDMEKADI